jgi:hypothetical protein
MGGRSEYDLQFWVTNNQAQKVVLFTNHHVTDKVNALPTMAGASSESFLTFEACCEHALKFSKHVSECTNEPRPDDPVAIP